MKTYAASALSSVLSRLPLGLADIRIANAAFRTMYKGGDSRRLRATLGNTLYELDLAEWTQAQAVMLRRYDPETVDFILSHLPQDGIYVEGGGHVGLIALQVAVARPDVAVHVFEPHPIFYPSLRANVALNSVRNVTLNQCGLSNAAGRLRFSVREYMVAAEGDAEVPVVRLDDYAAEHRIPRIDVLKLDIEGHELAALEGAETLFQAGVLKALTMEVSHPSGDNPSGFALKQGMREVMLPDLRPRWIKSLRRHRKIDNTGYLRQEADQSR